MARPQKQGIDYFPLDVNLDDKIELIDAKYGVQGFGIIIRLWQKIYSNSYFIEWNDNTLLLFKKAINVDINLINDIINDCFLWQIFDKNLYKKYKILTSKGIQKRYIEATQRRKEIEFIEEFLLIENVKEKYQKTVIVNINSINVNINSKKENIGTQSKVKNSKVKNSKVKNIIPPLPPTGEIGVCDYSLEDIISLCKKECPAAYIKFIEKYKSTPNGDGMYELSVAVTTIKQTHSLEELKLIFQKANKTYISKPSEYMKCDLVWILNNITKVLTEKDLTTQSVETKTEPKIKLNPEKMKKFTI